MSKSPFRAKTSTPPVPTPATKAPTARESYEKVEKKLFEQTQNLQGNSGVVRKALERQYKATAKILSTVADGDIDGDDSSVVQDYVGVKAASLLRKSENKINELKQDIALQKFLKIKYPKKKSDFTADELYNQILINGGYEGFVAEAESASKLADLHKGLVDAKGSNITLVTGTLFDAITIPTEADILKIGGIEALLKALEKTLPTMGTDEATSRLRKAVEAKIAGLKTQIESTDKNLEDLKVKLERHYGKLVDSKNEKLKFLRDNSLLKDLDLNDPEFDAKVEYRVFDLNKEKRSEWDKIAERFDSRRNKINADEQAIVAALASKSGSSYSTLEADSEKLATIKSELVKKKAELLKKDPDAEKEDKRSIAKKSDVAILDLEFQVRGCSGVTKKYAAETTRTLDKTVEYNVLFQEQIISEMDEQIAQTKAKEVTASINLGRSGDELKRILAGTDSEELNSVEQGILSARVMNSQVELGGWSRVQETAEAEIKAANKKIFLQNREIANKYRAIIESEIMSQDIQNDDVSEDASLEGSEDGLDQAEDFAQKAALLAQKVEFLEKASGMAAEIDSKERMFKVKTLELASRIKSEKKDLDLNIEADLADLIPNFNKKNLTSEINAAERKLDNEDKLAAALEDIKALVEIRNAYKTPNPANPVSPEEIKNNEILLKNKSIQMVLDNDADQEFLDQLVELLNIGDDKGSAFLFAANKPKTNEELKKDLTLVPLTFEIENKFNLSRYEAIKADLEDWKKEFTQVMDDAKELNVESLITQENIDAATERLMNSLTNEQKINLENRRLLENQKEDLPLIHRKILLKSIFFKMNSEVNEGVEIPYTDEEQAEIESVFANLGEHGKDELGALASEIEGLEMQTNSKPTEKTLFERVLIKLIEIDEKDRKETDLDADELKLIQIFSSEEKLNLSNDFLEEIKNTHFPEIETQTLLESVAVKLENNKAKKLLESAVSKIGELTTQSLLASALDKLMQEEVKELTEQELGEVRFVLGVGEEVVLDLPHLSQESVNIIFGKTQEDHTLTEDEIEAVRNGLGIDEDEELDLVTLTSEQLDALDEKIEEYDVQLTKEEQSAFEKVMLDNEKLLEGLEEEEFTLELKSDLVKEQLARIRMCDITAVRDNERKIIDTSDSIIRQYQELSYLESLKFVEFKQKISVKNYKLAQDDIDVIDSLANVFGAEINGTNDKELNNSRNSFIKALTEENFENRKSELRGQLTEYGVDLSDLSKPLNSLDYAFQYFNSELEKAIDQIPTDIDYDRQNTVMKALEELPIAVSIIETAKDTIAAQTIFIGGLPVDSAEWSTLGEREAAISVQLLNSDDKLKKSEREELEIERQGLNILLYGRNHILENAQKQVQASQAQGLDHASDEMLDNKEKNLSSAFVEEATAKATAKSLLRSFVVTKKGEALRTSGDTTKDDRVEEEATRKQTPAEANGANLAKSIKSFGDKHEILLPEINRATAIEGKTTEFGASATLYFEKVSDAKAFAQRLNSYQERKGGVKDGYDVNIMKESAVVDRLKDAGHPNNGQYSVVIHVNTNKDKSIKGVPESQGLVFDDNLSNPKFLEAIAKSEKANLRIAELNEKARVESIKTDKDAVFKQSMARAANIVCLGLPIVPAVAAVVGGITGALQQATSHPKLGSSLKVISEPLAAISQAALGVSAAGFEQTNLGGSLTKSWAKDLRKFSNKIEKDEENKSSASRGSTSGIYDNPLADKIRKALGYEKPPVISSSEHNNKKALATEAAEFVALGTRVPAFALSLLPNAIGTVSHLVGDAAMTAATSARDYASNKNNNIVARGLAGLSFVVTAPVGVVTRSVGIVGRSAGEMLSKPAEYSRPEDSVSENRRAMGFMGSISHAFNSVWDSRDLLSRAASSVVSLVTGQKPEVPVTKINLADKDNTRLAKMLEAPKRENSEPETATITPDQFKKFFDTRDHAVTNLKKLLGSSNYNANGFKVRIDENDQIFIKDKSSSIFHLTSGSNSKEPLRFDGKEIDPRLVKLVAAVVNNSVKADEDGINPRVEFLEPTAAEKAAKVAAQREAEKIAREEALKNKPANKPTPQTSTGKTPFGKSYANSAKKDELPREEQKHTRAEGTGNVFRPVTPTYKPNPLSRPSSRNTTETNKPSMETFAKSVKRPPHREFAENNFDKMPPVPPMKSALPARSAPKATVVPEETSTKDVPPVPARSAPKAKAVPEETSTKDVPPVPARSALPVKSTRVSTFQDKDKARKDKGGDGPGLGGTRF